MRCTLFCTVIDYLGDAGVSWRLARQLQSKGVQCSLLIDDLQTLRILHPGVQPQYPQQTLEGIHIHHWKQESDPLHFMDQDLWIECFACGFAEYIWDELALRPQTPKLYMLDYLGTEPWVQRCHNLYSIHPKTGLKQKFWIPGFNSHTGGLLREDILPSSTSDPLHNLPIPECERLISLFCYAHAPIRPLIDLLIQDHITTTLVYFPGEPTQALSHCLPDFFPSTAERRRTCTIGSLHLQPLDFLHVRTFDQLLCRCDCNIVRGEDSFIRAHWAGRPILWHAYPQAEQAQLDKLRGWMEQRTMTEAFQQLHWSFNQSTPPITLFAAALNALKAEQICTLDFRSTLLQQTSLADQLLADVASSA